MHISSSVSRDGRIITTQFMCLCLVFNSDKTHIILSCKKNSKYKGIFTPHGGHYDKNDISIYDGAQREFEEETTAKLVTMHKIGVVESHRVMGNQVYVNIVDIMLVEDYLGTIEETDSMGPPHWFNINRIKSSKKSGGVKYWPDFSYWLTYAVDGIKFESLFYYTGMLELVAWDVKTVDHFTFDDRRGYLDQCLAANTNGVSDLLLKIIK